MVIKNAQKIKASEKYLNNKINKFYEDGKDVKIKNLNQKKLTDILKSVKFDGNQYRTILKFGDSYLPLTPDRVKGLL